MVGESQFWNVSHYTLSPGRSGGEGEGGGDMKQIKRSEWEKESKRRQGALETSKCWRLFKWGWSYVKDPRYIKINPILPSRPRAHTHTRLKSHTHIPLDLRVKGLIALNMRTLVGGVGVLCGVFWWLRICAEHALIRTMQNLSGIFEMSIKHICKMIVFSTEWCHVTKKMCFLLSR